MRHTALTPLSVTRSATGVPPTPQQKSLKFRITPPPYTTPDFGPKQISRTLWPEMHLTQITPPPPGYTTTDFGFTQPAPLPPRGVLGGPPQAKKLFRVFFKVLVARQLEKNFLRVIYPFSRVSAKMFWDPYFLKGLV